MFSLNILNSFFGFKEIKINTLKITRLNKINKTSKFKKNDETYFCKKVCSGGAVSV